MRRFLYLLFVFITVSFSSVNKLPYEKYETWISPSTFTQFKNEGIDDEMGQGRVFIPCFTKPEWEGEYKIYYPGTKVQNAQIGQSYFLRPGQYSLLIGSTDNPQFQIYKRFSIQDQKTTFIEPDWSGLLVTIINQNREKVRVGYEIFDLNSGISLGTKYSKEEDEFDDARFTWILPAGKYKIVRNGEVFNTITNFTTVELNQGEFKEFTIVVDSETNKNFVGSGELEKTIIDIQNEKKWHDYLAIKGSFNLNSDNSVDKDDNKTDISFRSKVDNNIKYDIKPYYFSFKQKLTEEWTKNDEDDELRTTVDELDLNNTAIFYFISDFIGLYSELKLETKLFPGRVHNINKDVVKIDKEGNEEHIKNPDDFEISPSLYPLNLQEDIGLNFSIIKSSGSNFYIRSGIGFIQNFNDNVYEKESENDSIVYFREVDTYKLNGFVLGTGADIQLTNSLVYSTEANFIYGIGDKEDYRFNWDNNINVKISKYFAIDYNLDLNYESDRKYMIYKQQLSLEFSLYFVR